MKNRTQIQLGQSGFKKVKTIQLVNDTIGREYKGGRLQVLLRNPSTHVTAGKKEEKFFESKKKGMQGLQRSSARF
jgi:hypothetical protein